MLRYISMRAIIIALTLISWLPSAAQAALAENAKAHVATLVSITRLVRVQEKMDGPIVAAESGMKLAQGTIVSTLKDSRCEIKFSPAHIVRLGPSARIRIARLDEQKGTVRILVNLLGGRIRALVDRALREDADFGIYGVTTLTAVKGTDYDVIRDEDDRVKVLVNEGRVNVAEIESEDLEAVEKAFMALLLGNIGFGLTEGKMLDIIPGKAFPVPIPIPKGFPNIWGGKNDGHDKPKLPTLPGLGGGIGFP
jgi:hypothetical protein